MDLPVLKVLAITLQPLESQVHVGDVGHPAEKEDQGDGCHALGVAHVEPVLAVGGLLALHGPVQLADVSQLLAGDPQHPARHAHDEEDARQQKAVHLQVDVGHGEDLLVGAHLGIEGVGVVEGAADVVLLPLVPAKGRQGGVEQRGHPGRQQGHGEAAVDPALAVMQGADDAQVALVVNHHQIEQVGEEEEVGEGVDQEADVEVDLLLQGHAGDEGQRNARAQVGHEQAQEEVVGRVVQLPVAQDAHDDDQVGQDDGRGQRVREAGDESPSLL